MLCKFIPPSISGIMYNRTMPSRGNALFLILIAVALFAALSYAITQSGRGGGNIDREQAKIGSAQLIQQVTDVRTSIQRMILTGTPATQISLQTDLTAAPCDTHPENCLFSPDGGGAEDVLIPSAATNPHSDDTNWTKWPIGSFGASITYSTSDPQWHWGYADITDPVLGYYVEDLGTNYTITDDGKDGREAVAFLWEMSLPVCEEINRSLGMDPTPGIGGNVSNPTAHYEEATKFSGAPGQPFACTDIGSYYMYYHALIEQ